jgi:hypothetical protein
VLGTLQDASQGLSINGDNGPVRAVASVIGQEGEQNGFYRTFLARKPSQKPFLTTSIAPFAYSVLRQNFIVECPFSLDQIPIPTYPALNVITGNGGRDVPAQDQLLDFTADLTTASKPVTSCDGLFVTYFTGVDAPSSWPVQGCHWDGKKVAFQAKFPFTELVMEGLTVASLTSSCNFSNPDAVAAATLAAPGLIQVNDKLKVPTLY